jgi:hypothetical protein
MRDAAQRLFAGAVLITSIHSLKEPTIVNTYRSRVFALAAVVSLLLPACSGMTSSTVPQTGATRGTSSITTKKLTDTYKPFTVVPGGTAAAALGVKKWGYYAWTDKKTTSVAGLSSTGDIVWEIDVTADSNAGTESVISSAGTNFAQTQRNGPIYMYGRAPNDPKYVQALKTDTSAFTGYTGEGGGRPGGGGPLPASAVRQTRSQGDVYIAGAAFSWDLADVIVVACEVGLAAVPVAGWIALGLGAAALAVAVYNTNQENTPQPAPGPGYGDPGIPIITPSPGGGGSSGGSGTVTRVCVGDNFGNVTCWYTFYY